MTPIDPAELSAYLDGELSPARAREIEAAINGDPALRAEFERLRECDVRWRTTAAQARFSPAVTPVQAGAGMGARPGWVVAAVVALLIVRLLPKLMGSLLAGTAIHVMAFAAALAWIVRRLPLNPEDHQGPLGRES